MSDEFIFKRNGSSIKEDIPTLIKFVKELSTFSRFGKKDEVNVGFKGISLLLKSSKYNYAYDAAILIEPNRILITILSYGRGLVRQNLKQLYSFLVEKLHFKIYDDEERKISEENIIFLK